MGTTSILLLAIPALWPLIAKLIWPHTISYREMAINMILPGVAAVLFLNLGTYSKMADTEFWNGEITGKEHVWVSCEHSYECNCSTDDDGNRSCDTCYDHTNDWDWRVHTNIGDFNISRIDRRGSHEPPRWTAVQPGQPASRENTYVNYVKAVPDSLMHLQSSLTDAYADTLPDYPRLYDYHHADRVIPIGVTLPNLEAWNHDLAIKLRRIGPEKQANVVIVIVDEPSDAYADALAAHWLGGKKNDVTVIIGSPSFPKIAWVRILAWTDEEIFKIELRNALLDLEELDRTAVIETIDSTVHEFFVRKPMADFEYLKDEIDPPVWALVLAMLVVTAGNVGLSLVFRNTDI